MRTIAVGIGLALLGGCKESASKQDDNKASSGSAAAGSAATKPASTLALTRDGKPVPLEHAFIKQLPDGKRQLYVGEGGNCEQLLTNVFDSRNLYVLFDLPTILAADGSESTAVGDIYVGPSGAPDPGATASVKGLLAKGGKVDVTLAVTSKEAKVDAKGTISAESCGDQDTSTGPLPKAPHASTATMTIANKAIPIRAALVHGDKIELFDFPRDCPSAWFIGARLAHDGSWTLGGTRFAQEVNGAGEGLTATKGTAGTSPDGPTVQVTVGGEGKVGDYAVKLAGTIEALDCK